MVNFTSNETGNFDIFQKNLRELPDQNANALPPLDSAMAPRHMKYIQFWA